LGSDGAILLDIVDIVDVVIGYHEIVSAAIEKGCLRKTDILLEAVMVGDVTDG
jgi:hypothetical protein